MYNKEKEISEAIVAADAALEYLKKADQYLDTAKGWGVVDIIGGGFFSTMRKRNRTKGTGKGQGGFKVLNQGTGRCQRDSDNLS